MMLGHQHHIACARVAEGFAQAAGADAVSPARNGSLNAS
jgi:hypothetical protein